MGEVIDFGEKFHKNAMKEFCKSYLTNVHLFMEKNNELIAIDQQIDGRHFEVIEALNKTLDRWIYKFNNSVWLLSVFAQLRLEPLSTGEGVNYLELIIKNDLVKQLELVNEAFRNTPSDLLILRSASVTDLSYTAIPLNDLETQLTDFYNDLTGIPSNQLVFIYLFLKLLARTFEVIKTRQLNDEFKITFYDTEKGVLLDIRLFKAPLFLNKDVVDYVEANTNLIQDRNH